MPRLIEYQITSLEEYITRLESLHQKNEPLWFRGITTEAHKLLPSLFRYKKTDNQMDLFSLERDLNIRFKQRSIPFLDRPLSDPWGNLFFMQHYGIPTRLLDWSENAFIGLYFAVMCDNPNPQANAVVWVLNPIRWNRHALRSISYNEGVLSPGDQGLKSFAPGSDVALMHTNPVAIYGEYNSQRITSQQGVFLLFGKENKPLEDLFVDEAFPVESLTKLIIPMDKKEKLRESLLFQGTIESVVFPGIDGIAMEIKRHFGFV